VGPGLGTSYRRLVLASALSNLADGVFQVALPLLAVTLTTSPGLVAGVALAQRLPWLVMALPAGALADRLDRRLTMINVDLLRVVVLLVLTTAVATEVATMPMIYGLALVLGVGETLFDTAAQSILPSVVDRSRLSEANGRLFAVELVANQFVGPPLGGLLAAVTLAAAFGATSAAYLLAALCLVTLSGVFRPDRAGPRPRMRADIVEGLRFVWSNPILRTLGLMLGLTNLAFSAHMAVFVLFAVAPGPMGLTKEGFGLLVASGAFGGLAGSWVAPHAERLLGRARCLAIVTLTFGAALAVPALTPSIPANAAARKVGGTGSVVWNVITVSLRQRITPDRLLGRMNAAYRLLGWGTMPVGAALGGAVAEVSGLRATFVVAAALHLPLLAGFLVVTDRAIATAEAVQGPDSGTVAT
jgi:MFS family permease